jgi:hypothetical protein
VDGWLSRGTDRHIQLYPHRYFFLSSTGTLWSAGGPRSIMVSTVELKVQIHESFVMCVCVCVYVFFFVEERGSLKSRSLFASVARLDLKKILTQCGGPVMHVWKYIIRCWWDLRFSRQRVWRWLSVGCFRGPYCLHHPDDGGSKVLWNVGQYLEDYTLQHSKRQPSLY